MKPVTRWYSRNGKVEQTGQHARIKENSTRSSLLNLPFTRWPLWYSFPRSQTSQRPLSDRRNSLRVAEKSKTLLSERRNSSSIFVRSFSSYIELADHMTSFEIGGGLFEARKRSHLLNNALTGAADAVTDAQCIATGCSPSNQHPVQTNTPHLALYRKP